MAARAGLISREEACARYSLSDEELLAWERAFDSNGVGGLRTTYLQSYRFAYGEQIAVEIREPRGPMRKRRFANGLLLGYARVSKGD